MRKPDKPWKTIKLDLKQPIIDDSIYLDTRKYIETRNARNDELSINESERQSDDDSDIAAEAGNFSKSPPSLVLKKTNTAMMDNDSVADIGSASDDIDEVCNSLNDCLSDKAGVLGMKKSSLDGVSKLE